VFTLPVTGGTPTPYFGLPESTVELDREVTGVAAGGGRIWITRRFAGGTPPQQSRVRSTIEEVSPSGEMTTLAIRDRVEEVGVGIVKNEGRWVRIAATPDGQRLAVEGRFGPTGDDLYLFDLP
jgi:hypothetical protein